MSEQGKPEGTPGAGEQAAPELPRQRRLILLATALALLGSVVVAVVVFAGEGPDAEGMQQADGAIVEITDDRLVFRPSEPIDGEDQIVLAIRPEDLETLDLEHLEYHAAIGDPIRVHYERDDDEYIVRQTTELPGFR